MTTENTTQAPIHDPATEGATPLDRSKTGGPCGCGCGRVTKRGSHFLQGHDQRLKGMLQRVTKGKAFEGEPAAVAALIKRGHPGFSSSTMAPLIKEARAALVARGLIEAKAQKSA